MDTKHLDVKGMPSSNYVAEYKQPPPSPVSVSLSIDKKRKLFEFLEVCLGESTFTHARNNALACIQVLKNDMNTNSNLDEKGIYACDVLCSVIGKLILDQSNLNTVIAGLDALHSKLQNNQQRSQRVTGLLSQMK
jgi:hypothetical protein